MRRIATFTLAFTAAAALTLTAQQIKGPVETYMAYLDACAKATSLDAVLPYFTAEMEAGWKKAPKAQQDNFFKFKIKGENLSDVKVVTQKTEGKKTRLTLTAKTAAGRQATGDVTMVQEGTAWKVDEDAWNMPTP